MSLRVLITEYMLQVRVRTYTPANCPLTHTSRIYAVATARSVVKHQPISNWLPQAFNAVRQQSMLTSQRWLICISLYENRRAIVVRECCKLLARRAASCRKNIYVSSSDVANWELRAVNTWIMHPSEKIQRILIQSLKC